MLFNFGKKQENQSGAAKILKVVTARCPQNHPCPAVRVCPVKALTQVGYGAPDVDQEKCIHCGKCVKFCPMRAIVLE